MEEIDEAFELFDRGEYEQAEQMYLRCLDELKDEKSASYSSVLNGLGYVKSHQGQFEKAKQYFNGVLQIAFEEDDKNKEAMALHQLGMVERMAGKYESALAFFKREHKIWQQHFPDFYTGFSANSYERGFIAFKQEQHERAEKLFISALDYAKGAKSPVAKGCAYRGLGELNMAKLRFREAAIYFRKALLAFEEADDPTGAAEIQAHLQQSQLLLSENREGGIKNDNKGNPIR